MAFTIPTVANFKTQFARDFPYAVPASGTGGDATDSSKVMDSDITSAINLAQIQVNPNLFGTQAKFTQAFLYLAAHYLVLNLQASFSGISGQAMWLTSAKSVGNVSESISVPERILRSPYLASLSKTTYGAIYVQIIFPLLTGNIVGIIGDTNP